MCYHHSFEKDITYRAEWAAACSCLKKSASILLSNSAINREQQPLKEGSCERRTFLLHMDTEWSRSRRHDDDSVVLLYYLYGDALAREYDLPRPPPVRLDPNGRMSFDVGGWGNGGEGIGGGGGGGGGGRPHNGSGSGSSSTPLQDGTTISSNSGGGGGGGADETEFGMADIR